MDIISIGISIKISPHHLLLLLIVIERRRTSTGLHLLMVLSELTMRDARLKNEPALWTKRR